MSESLLREKQLECDAIQKSFDEYVESSKELESELEIALEESEVKIAELTKKKQLSDERAKEYYDKISQISKDYSKCQSELLLCKTSVTQSEERKIELEVANENLNSRVRILEATEEDLKHQLSNVEEDIIFLQGDLQGMHNEKLALEERLNKEIAELKSALQLQGADPVISPSKTSSKAIDSSLLESLTSEMNKTVESLQQEVTEANNRTDEAVAQNNELIDELSKVTDELLTLRETINQNTIKMTELQKARDADTQTIGRLEKELAALREQLVVKDGCIQDLLTQQSNNSNSDSNNSDSEVLSEMKAQLSEKESIMAELREQIASFIDISDKEKQQLESNFQEQITRLRKELDSAKANVNKGISPQDVTALNTTLLSNNGLSSHITNIIANGNSDKINSDLLKLVADNESIRRSNAKLLCKLQSLQGNIQVCCRPRPPTELELSQGKLCVDVADDCELMCYDGRVEAWKTFMFDRVWRFDCGQADVFADVEPMVVSVVDGYNVCIMAYGQTGSGKTFTMDGYGGQYGVSYRTIQRLFDLLAFKKTQQSSLDVRSSVTTTGKLKTSTSSNLLKASLKKQSPLSLSSASLDLAGTSSANSPVVDSPIDLDGTSGKLARTESFDPTDLLLPATVGDAEGESNVLADDADLSGFSYTVEISMMEIYNEQVYDLLSHSTGGGQSDGVSLDIRQGPDNVVSVPGLKQVAVTNIDEVMSVFSKGTANRATSSTNLNEHSSRSHLIILVEVTTRISNELTLKGKLHLVDLAGSERVGKSGVTGAAMKEAQYINKSLSALGDVMEALDQKSKHVPYRNSKLTYLLQNSLGGNSRTMMIVTICPTDLTFDESLFTLQFATRVRNITTGPAVKNSNAKNLELLIKTLKGELKETKRKKQLLEDAVADSKKELKKAGERVTVPETKLKSLEEAKQKSDSLLQQLTKQLNEATFALSTEKETKEQLVTDLQQTKINLKKANDSGKDFAKENERLQLVSKARERENEKLRAQIAKLEAQQALVLVSSNKRGNSPAQQQSPSHSLQHPTPILLTPVGSAAKGVESTYSLSSSRYETSVNGINDLSLSPMLKANSVASDYSVDNSVPQFNISGVAAKPKSVGSYAQGTANSVMRTAMGPPLTTATSAVKNSGGILDGGASRVRNASSSAIPIPMRRSTSVTRSPFSSDTVNSSAEKRSFSSDNSAATTSAPVLNRMPLLSARSEEALKRHQARMDKKRESMAVEKLATRKDAMV